MRTTHRIILMLTLLFCGAQHGWAKDGTLSAHESAVKTVDRMIETNLLKQEIQPFEPISDQVFLRRIYLDVIGRIPNYEEASSFMNDEAKNKRSKLIDQLLNSEGYISDQYNFWADILRIKTKVRNQVSGAPYIDWLKDTLKKNTPYDTMVRELITASGSAWEKGNGATGYYLRDGGMPEDNMANTAQIFLGTQLQCAQCHDHPFDKWKRKDFYQLLAFTGNTRVTNVKKKQFNRKIRDMGTKIKEQPLDVKRAVRRIVTVIGLGVEDKQIATVPLPKDYQYDDGKPGKRVEAKTIFGEQPKFNSEISPREAYAQWMTSPKNPRFTTVVANRLWKKVMGLGLIEPVDDFNDTTQASNPELMKYLENLVIDNKYDLKKIYRILYNSQAYQRETLKTDLNLEKVYHFPGPVRGRMSAEQIWDSVLGLVMKDIDKLKGVEGESLVYDQYDKYKDASAKEIYQLAINTTKARKANLKIGARIKEIQKALKIASQDKDKKTVSKLRAELKELREERKKNYDVTQMKKEARKKADSDMKKEFGKGFFGKMVFRRASELSSPAPQAHFLRQLGQSDRELIQNENRSPNVTQVLSFYNGFVGRYITNPNTVLVKQMKKGKSDDDIIKIMFTTILSRAPQDHEVEWVKDHLKGLKGLKKAQGYADVIWALLNTHEFMFYS